MITEILNLLNASYGGAHGAEIAPDTPLLSSGLIDSVSTLELVDQIERTFNLEFAPHEVDRDNLDTAEKIAAFVATKKGA